MYIYRHPKKKRPIYESIIAELEGTDDCDTEDLKVGKSFWNARGTSGDMIKYHGKDMYFIDFWEKATGQSKADIDNLCANAQCPYGEDINKYALEGAHIVFEGPEGDVQDGDEMCIVPLCPKCNNATNTGKMKLRYNVTAPIIIWREEE